MCADIRGRVWGYIDFRSCAMTSLVSDRPVYIGSVGGRNKTGNAGEDVPSVSLNNTIKNSVVQVCVL